jgi:hypothetical protein
MHKLLGYVLDGSVLGTDIITWNNDDLQGNSPFMSIDASDNIPAGYSDISSIATWGSFGDVFFPKEPLSKTRSEIRGILTQPQIDGSLGDLSEDEINVLDKYQLINCFKIYDYIFRSDDNTDFKAPPYNIDYDIIGLHKKKTYNKGELSKIEYYGSYDFTTNTYSDLVLVEDFIYYRINEMVYKHQLDISWYLNTGEVGSSKQLVKYYTQEQSFALGESRRRNCITNLKINAVGLIMTTESKTQQEAEALGWLFLSEFNPEISVFIEGFSQPLKDAVMNTANHSWMDNVIPDAGGLTVRLYLHDGINIDYTINNTYV